MSEKNQPGSRDGKLKSALRDNLKKRKQQTRKLGSVTEETAKFSVKLRDREISGKKPG